jgi:hypothetical protein
MFYLGIDQHARQITIPLRDESGDVVQARQVSTQPEKVHAFFQQLTRERLHNGESFVAGPGGAPGDGAWVVSQRSPVLCPG